MATTTPDPHAAGSTRNSQWWVIDIHSRGFSGFKAIMATVKPPTNPQSSYAAGPFASQPAANRWIQQNQTTGGLPSLPNPLSALGGWLGSIGAQIGSGIESGFISAIKDVWTVIIGPLEVLLGALIIMFTLAMYFKGEILGLASIAAMAAA